MKPDEWLRRPLTTPHDRALARGIERTLHRWERAAEAALHPKPTQPNRPQPNPAPKEPEAQ